MGCSWDLEASGDLRSIVRVKVVGEGVVGVEVEVPNGPPLVLLRGRNGIVACGFLDVAVADKLGVVAARAFGVKSVEELLEKEIVEATSRARELGIREGVRVRDIVKVI